VRAWRSTDAGSQRVPGSAARPRTSSVGEHTFAGCRVAPEPVTMSHDTFTMSRSVSDDPLANRHHHPCSRHRYRSCGACRSASSQGRMTKPAEEESLAPSASPGPACSTRHAVGTTPESTMRRHHSGSAPRWRASSKSCTAPGCSAIRNSPRSNGSPTSTACHSSRPSINQGAGRACHDLTPYASDRYGKAGSGPAVLGDGCRLIGARNGYRDREVVQP
jgi:hypothetical protein